jgi:hypothetical protein
MSKELSYEDTQILVDRMIDLEAEAMLNDRSILVAMVRGYLGEKYSNMTPQEIFEEAEYHGVIEYLTEVK